MQRREFLRILALAAAAGGTLRAGLSAAQAADELYELPPLGNVSLLHFTDSHAQLLPIHFREPSVNIGAGAAAGKPPHLVDKALLAYFGIPAASALAHAFTSIDFEAAARRYGKVGGFAHLAALVRRLRGARPHALLLDGGDTWQGSALSLWTRGVDMIGAQKLLGVDAMTAHWEFTYGAQRVKDAVERELAPIEFVAQNVKTVDFEDPVFRPYTLRSLNGVPVAIIGQAFPYTPIAHPRYLVADWSFGIQERRLQKLVEEVRAKGARLVVLLSHNGMDVDLKLAARVRGLDVILGGHTHDGVPAPVVVGQTLVTNAGCSGKFLAVLDLDVGDGGIRRHRYRLLPVFANLLPADPEMAAYIEQVRAPHRAKLEAPLALTEGLLYRRGNFNGTWDQLILDALMAERDAEIGFSPGFRWGTTLLPGEPILREHLMDQTAITYPFVTLNELTGAQIKGILEDICDNLFNPDPYLQQGGDMVRVGGMAYTCTPTAAMGRRISEMRLDGKPIQADGRYKVVGWAPVAEGASGEPCWQVVERYLKSRKTIPPRAPNVPALVGVEGNPGYA
ncbi:MAG TPA: thiosulfohydrolase SoxB [Burkholderiales bacterium]|nr:thiosulfohydrolase SoxB [Burkholderiales bacterium]